MGDSGIFNHPQFNHYFDGSVRRIKGIVYPHTSPLRRTILWLPGYVVEAVYARLQVIAKYPLHLLQECFADAIAALLDASFSLPAGGLEPPRLVGCGF